MPVYKFNDKQGNRDRACMWAILHEGRIYNTAESKEAKLAVFKAVGFEKNGKWSNTDWEVHTVSAKLIVIMPPFEGWGEDLSKCVSHVINSCKSYLGWEPSEEEATLFFTTKYPKTFARITAKAAEIANLV